MHPARSSAARLDSRSIVLLCTCAAGLVLGLAASRAGGQTIRIDADQDATTCYVGYGSVVTTYIVAILGPLPGITGAEFSVYGLPAGVFASPIGNPAATVTIGNPFQVGCNIAFPTCQTSDTAVLLYTVNLFTLESPPPDYILAVQAHDLPNNPAFPCPLVALCDAPVYTLHCVSPSQNATRPILPVPSDPSPADGAVNVPLGRTLTWGHSGESYCCGIGTSSHNVYFGTDPNPPLVEHVDSPDQASYTPALAPYTTYYWRIESTPDGDCGTRSGPVWSFTTANVTVANDVTTWGQVKGLFR
jgi:hypothetical protein